MAVNTICTSFCRVRRLDLQKLCCSLAHCKVEHYSFPIALSKIPQVQRSRCQQLTLHSILGEHLKQNRHASLLTYDTAAISSHLVRSPISSQEISRPIHTPAFHTSSDCAPELASTPETFLISKPSKGFSIDLALVEACSKSCPILPKNHAEKQISSSVSIASTEQLR
jgi:hypothetical protein